MTFPNFFRPRRAAPLPRLSCPFCPGSTAQSGPLCSVCRDEALRLGSGH